MYKKTKQPPPPKKKKQKKQKKKKQNPPPPPPPPKKKKKTITKKQQQKTYTCCYTESTEYYFEYGLEVNLVQLTEKVLTLMHEEWQSKIPYKPKLRTFSLFKQDMETEAYIKTYSKSKRSILCQLRIGILPLEIELGRYVRLKINERTCKLCKKDVEDEIHFVCVCPALELIRMKYFKILNIDKSELLIDQLSRVLTHMNVNMVINFIFDLWQERKSKLYC